MQTGNTNNNRSNNSTNTRSHQFYMDTEQWARPVTLVTGFWNTMVTVKMHPALSPEKRTNNQVYDYETFSTTAISPEKALALVNRLEEVVIPEAKKGNAKSVAAAVSGGQTLVVIGFEKFEESDNDLDAYISIIRVGENFKAEEAITYVFNSLSLITDYDKETGAYDIAYDERSEFRLFVSFLKTSAELLSMVTAHSARTVDRYFREQLKGALNIQSGGGFNNRGGRRRNAFVQNRQNKIPEESITNASDIDDMM